MSEPSTEYSLPGVLHYLQAEWRKFEREKNEWAIERAELNARIALLEGERRSLENIKPTLMKRVKMLEYALRQERKIHTSQVDNTTAETTFPTSQVISATNKSTLPYPKQSDVSMDNSKMKEKSREVLRSCLQEINYLTSLPSKLPLTSALTTRSLNDLSRASSVIRAPHPSLSNSNTNSPVLTGANTRNNSQQRSSSRSTKPSASSPTKKSFANNSPIPRAATLSISSQPDSKTDEEDLSVEDDDMEIVPANVDEVAMIHNIKEEAENYNASQSDNNESFSTRVQEKFHLSEEKVKKLLRHAEKGSSSKANRDHLLMGDFDPNQIGDIDNNQNQIQPKIWKPRVTIKGHLDSVRAVCFHPTEMIAASGSDDGTVKIWNLQRTSIKDGGNSFKKGSSEEADPSITFRGHTNAVTSVIISAVQNRVYSTSLDSTIRVWSLPSEESGPFSPMDPSLNIATFIGHTDAIWDAKLSPAKDGKQLLASASADGTVKIWDTASTGNLLKSSITYDGVISTETYNKEKIAPTSVVFLHTEENKIAVSFVNAAIRIYDIETGQILLTLKESNDSFDNTFATQINCIITHPTLPILVSGHEDQHVKFFDLKSGECLKSVSHAHPDAITTLDIDSTGTNLASGGHDSSIRLWDMDQKICRQEFSAHRRKGDEGVLSVQFHPSFPWMISGGADGIVKIYHHAH